MLNLKRIVQKPIKCERCGKKITEYNVDKDGRKICEPCTNL